MPTGFLPLLLTNKETKLNLEISNIYSVLNKFLHSFLTGIIDLITHRNRFFCGTAIRINIKYHNKTSLREHPVFSALVSSLPAEKNRLRKRDEERISVTSASIVLPMINFIPLCEYLFPAGSGPGL